MSSNSVRVGFWWVLALLGAAVTLLVVWAAGAVHVSANTLLAVAVVVVALSWLVALVTVPWNLYFGARRAAQEMIVARERGIDVRASYDDEAGRIANRMLRFAIGGHLGTAIAAALVAYVSGNKTGYYLAGIFLLATVFRPAFAYLAHVRERITVFSQESTYPRGDVVTLQARLDVAESLLRETVTDLQRARASFADDLEHARDQLSADISRLRETQDADRTQAASRHDEVKRQIEQMARRIEAALDGLSDRPEMLAGLRALVRMIRSDPI